MDSNRIQWIDLCKGIGIFLVVLGHTLQNDISTVYIYGFHMPLFFFLSGLVCNEHKYTWTTFLKNRFNTIVIPYLIFYIITWVYWLIIERSFRPLGLEWWEPLIGMLYGAQWQNYMAHNGILWFLPCLFTTEILFFAIKKVPNIYSQIALIITLAGIGFSIKLNLPWCINIAFVALQFFYIGNIVRMKLLKSENTKTNYMANFIVALSASITYLLLSAHWLNHVNMATNSYGSIVFFEPLAYIGTIGLIYICKSVNINKLGGGYLGRNTLVIFAFHQPILRIVRFMGEKLLSVFPVETNLIYALIADSVVLICLYPCITIWNKYCKSLLHNINLH